MSKVLIIGAGGVGNVVTQKCAMNPNVFSGIVLASRTVSKCEHIRRNIQQALSYQIDVAQVDADDVTALVALINTHKPDLVLNVALPYQDLSIMDACLETGVDYLDTANYEPRDSAKFEYHWQWAYHERFKERGITALLGSGFDPGVTNVFTAYAAKHYLDEIHTLDIIDVNGGDHGKPFATNFNPEINIREVSAPSRHWEDGQFVETSAMSEKQTFDCPDGVGSYNIYRMYHEELESLTRHFTSIRKAQFWMSFSENYLNHLQVLKNVGMTRIDEIEYQGQKIVPLQFLKAVLPNPGDLGQTTVGQTCIGNIVRGIKNGREAAHYIYNICDHESCYKEVGSQAISYTTGVPAMIGAMMLLTQKWRGPGVFNMEQFDPDPFMEQLKLQGLPWTVKKIA